MRGFCRVAPCDLIIHAAHKSSKIATASDAIPEVSHTAACRHTHAGSFALIQADQSDGPG